MHEKPAIVHRKKGFPFIFWTNFPREIELRLEKHGTLSRASSSVIQERELFNEPPPNPIFRTETLLNKVFTHTAGDLQAVLSSSHPLQTSVKSHPWNGYWWSCDVQICSSDGLLDETTWQVTRLNPCYPTTATPGSMRSGCSIKKRLRCGEPFSQFVNKAVNIE